MTAPHNDWNFKMALTAAVIMQHHSGGDSLVLGIHEMLNWVPKTFTSFSKLTEDDTLLLHYSP